MENVNELQRAEDHLRRAEAELKEAETQERRAGHEIEEALEEIREIEHVAKHEIEEALEEIREIEHVAKHEILLEIATPKGLFEGIFPETTKISTVIEIVVDKKGLDKKDTFELVHGDKVLQPNSRTLESFGLKHKAKIELVATGSGV